MTLRQIVRQVLPPVITTALIKVIKMRRGRERPEWEYVPEGWRRQKAFTSNAARERLISEAAERLSAQGLEAAAAGWNVESVVRAQRAKWDRFVALMGADEGTAPLAVYHEVATLSNDSLVAHHTFITYGYVLALAARAATQTAGRRDDRLSILDWGSGIGHYFIVSRALLPDVTLDYHARDLPLLCEAGRAMIPEITFHDNDADALGAGTEAGARRYDLIVASSSLQYREDWRDILRGFAAASRRYVYVARLPIVHRAPSFVVIQRPHASGYDTSYLGWFLNREEFLTAAREAGLRLAREFLADERPYAHGAPEQCEFRGFLFEVS
jgi:putative methyltransferase (TIGR04325 family)